MKNFYFLIIVMLASTYLVAQTPQAFKYQAIARDEAGNVLSIRDIRLRVSLIQKGDNEKAVYVETFKVQTNIYGLINLIIGEGDVVLGEFKAIKWGEHNHFLKIEMDIDGGGNYKEAGISQLYAVPYALYAEQAGELADTDPANTESGQRNDAKKAKKSSGNRDVTPNSKFPADTSSYLNVNTGNVGIGTTDPQEKLDVTGRIMSTLGYNTNGNDGLSDTLNLVTNISFDSLKLQYRTLAFNGGILTYISDTSDWVDSVGSHILPLFLCGDSLTDTRDGKKYGTVLIGTQCWMSENMNIGIMIPGSQEMANTGTFEKYCYEDNSANCDTYGGLYQWNEMMQYVTTEGAQGICPAGWHLPTDAEWCTLENYVDVGSVSCSDIGWRGTDAGGNLKETGTTHWLTPNTGATNSSGFTALPGGTRGSSGSFGSLGIDGYWWSSTEYSGSGAWVRFLRYYASQVYRSGYDKSSGRSVRCLKN